MVHDESAVTPQKRTITPVSDSADVQVYPAIQTEQHPDNGATTAPFDPNFDASRAEAHTTARTESSVPSQTVAAPRNPLTTTVSSETSHIAHFHDALRTLATEFDSLTHHMVSQHSSYERLAAPFVHGLQDLFRATINPSALSPATYTSPKEPTPVSKTQKSWADIAKTKPSQPTAFTPKESPRAPPKTSNTGNDTRIMIRLPSDHPARQADNYATRLSLNKIIGKDIVKDIHLVPSGLALVTNSATQANELLKYRAMITTHFGDAVTAERQEKWTSFLVSGVPKFFHDHEGRVDIDAELITNEIHTQTGFKPRCVSWTRRSIDSLEPMGVAYIAIPQTSAPAWPGRLRVFGHAVSARPLRHKSVITTCERCFGYHSSRSCNRPLQCKECSATRHEGPCMTAQRCVNCRGPHASGDAECPARPLPRNGSLLRPDRQQLRLLRSTQGRLWKERNGKSQPLTTTPPLPEPTAHGQEGSMALDG